MGDAPFESIENRMLNLLDELLDKQIYEEVTQMTLPKTNVKLGENEVEKFLGYAEDVLSDLDDMPEKANSFAESAKELILGIMNNIETYNRVTFKQREAVENIEEAVENWNNR